MLDTIKLPKAKLPAKRTNTSPQAWAKTFAATNLNFSGVLTVVSVTNKGRGAWGTTDKRTKFYCMGGIAALTVEHHEPADPCQPYGPRRYYRNGYCQCCGKLTKNPALTLAWDGDKQIVACLTCIFKNQFVLRNDRADYRAVRLTAEFSSLAVHTDDTAPQATLDIRGATPVAVVPFSQFAQPITVNS